MSNMTQPPARTNFMGDNSRHLKPWLGDAGPGQSSSSHLTARKAALYMVPMSFRLRRMAAVVFMVGSIGAFSLHAGEPLYSWDFSNEEDAGVWVRCKPKRMDPLEWHDGMISSKTL